MCLASRSCSSSCSTRPAVRERALHAAPGALQRGIRVAAGIERDPVLEDDQRDGREVLRRGHFAPAADEVGVRDAFAVSRQLAGARVGGPLAEQACERAVEVGVQGVDQHHAGDVAGPAARVQLRDVAAERGADDHHRPRDVLRVQEGPGLEDHGGRAGAGAPEGAGRRRLLVTAAARNHGEQQSERRPRLHVGEYP